MKPLIKWPGGKSEEIEYFKDIIPSYKRYIEPFVGGGAVYFYLPNTPSIINDISFNLTNFYKLLKEQNNTFKNILESIDYCWKLLQKKCVENIEELKNIYFNLSMNEFVEEKLKNVEKKILNNIINNEFIIDKKLFIKEIEKNVLNKYKRTIRNEVKNNSKLSTNDLEDNIITGFTSGFYMYIRDEHNRLEKTNSKDIEYRTALFYFVREYCYGSMFRYNSKGEFNIPYGGISYNKKDFNKKISLLFNNEIKLKFKDTVILNGDFEQVLAKLDEDDFVFVDPPYDTEFSDYEGRAFDKNEQIRLKNCLERTNAKFVLIIKYTDFIYDLYDNEHFKIKMFDKNYSYCVKNRNERKVEHLIITNY